jgi:RNA polymerase sigma-70 factor (ECF subfamily)
VGADLPLASLLTSRLDRAAQCAPELEDALEQALARAHRAWPSLALADAEFVGDLAERLPASVDLVDAVRALCAEDLFLASLCRRGDPRALEEFERRVMPEARAALLIRRQPPEVVEEALQVLRARLFVAEGGAAKIGGYSGRGPLGAWVRMAALRTALNLTRGRAGRDHDELRASRLEAPAVSPELGFLKARYRGDFKAAFEAAFAGLSTRERTLLRLSLLDGLSTAQLGRIYRADPSSVRRWLAETRRRLLEGTRRELAARLDASERELDSIMGLLVTQLEDSVRRILGAGRGEE